MRIKHQAKKRACAGRKQEVFWLDHERALHEEADVRCVCGVCRKGWISCVCVVCVGRDVDWKKPKSGRRPLKATELI